VWRASDGLLVGVGMEWRTVEGVGAREGRVYGWSS